jgi:hypothetical protein
MKFRGNGRYSGVDFGAGICRAEIEECFVAFTGIYHAANRPLKLSRLARISETSIRCYSAVSGWHHANCALSRI